MTPAIPIAVLLGLVALLFGVLARRAYRRHRRQDPPPPTIDPNLVIEAEAHQVEPQTT